MFVCVQVKNGFIFLKDVKEEEKEKVVAETIYVHGAIKSKIFAVWPFTGKVILPHNLKSGKWGAKEC